MSSDKHDYELRLANVPDLFRRLMGQPLEPLTRARLPTPDAVYVLYQEGEPVHVGSPPHLEERMLAPSLRLSLAAHMHRPVGGGAPRISLSRSSPPPIRRNPVMARWLPVADEHDRLLLELYAAQSLGLSISHPRIRAELVDA